MDEGADRKPDILQVTEQNQQDLGDGSILFRDSRLQQLL